MRHIICHCSVTSCALVLRRLPQQSGLDLVPPLPSLLCCCTTFHVHHTARIKWDSEASVDPCTQLYYLPTRPVRFGVVECPANFDRYRLRLSTDLLHTTIMSETYSPAPTPPESPVHGPSTPPGLTPPSEVDELSLLDPSSTPTTPDASSSNGVLLPFPTSSDAAFAFSEMDTEGHPHEPLPSELAAAAEDITVAPDGSFVETSSGALARELKRRYDNAHGVSPTVRSPYTITALINQHGRQMYRIGRRDKKTPPGASALEAEERVTSTVISPASDHGHGRARSPRRSRISVSMFNKTGLGAAAGGSGAVRSGANGGAGLALPGQSSGSTGTRKLRKTRSSSELVTSEGSSRPNGRGHSQSVTSADYHPASMTDSMISSASHGGAADAFAGIMGWGTPALGTATGSTSSFSNSTSNISSPPASSSISSPSGHKNPFGGTIHFESPVRKVQFELLPMPRHLREMQSFESGLTAKQTDHTDGLIPEGLLPREAFDTDPQRPPSAMRVRDSMSSEAAEAPAPAPAAPSGPQPETLLLSRYQGDIFTVLQTYRGLPLLDRLGPGEETTVIKLSSSDNNAAPKDDPRFVIWGEPVSERERDADERSLSGVTDGSSSSSRPRRNTKVGKGKTPDLPGVKLDDSSAVVKVLVAATIERWIAQLTSDLKYDELLNFFLTYRTYISAVDLCHLLICRFHWALQTSSSPQDEFVRRVVRVRTFVAFRYWITNFFALDFLPDRELRVSMATWLNTLWRDPILQKLPDGLALIRKLRKVVRDHKTIYTRAPASQEGTTSANTPSSAASDSSHVLGESFAAATRNAAVVEDDADIDLDFVADENNMPYTPPDFIADTRNSIVPISSLTVMQRTDPLGGDAPVVGNAALPMHHNVLSRAFVKTMGQLGRWKRVLNQRSTGVVRTPLGACADPNAIDLELTVGRDMLSVNGGFEQYLKMKGNGAAHVRSTPLMAAPHEATKLFVSPPPPIDMPEPAIDQPEPEAEPEPEPSAESAMTESAETKSAETEPAPVDEPRPESLAESVYSFRSSSTDSFGAPVSSTRALFPGGAQSQFQFDIVSIDDLDLSDNSSDGPAAPPGLRQPLRRLPRQFEFAARHRSDTVSSMGLHSTAHSSIASSNSAAAEPINGGAIHQWQMNALVQSLSDDEEEGDVEAALNRLEGQINPTKQQEKLSKVDGWMRTMRDRFLNGDYDENLQRQFSDDEEEEVVEEEANAVDDGEDDVDQNLGESDLAIEEMATPVISAPPMSPPKVADEARPVPEEAVPLEILQSRVPPRASMSKFVTVPGENGSRFHRSFILAHRAVQTAEHFAMIDKQLFVNVRIEEIMEDWMAYDDSVEVLDWAQYLKEKAAGSGLAAVRARFNLMTSFVASEIVLSPPSARPAVAAKFIRIAWRSYRIGSYNTLVAIIAGLRSSWVTQALRNWKSVGRWELRVLNDLREFVTHSNDFKYIRQAIAETKTQDAVVDVDQAAARRKSISTGEAKPQSCVPFIGVYLSQLYRHHKLPDLIDPTAPSEPVGIDPVTANFDPPAHPEVFSALAPLPDSIHLEPLINVQKQRLIAGVIKSLVAVQGVAGKVQFPVEKRMYQKCLKLRALDADTMRRALGSF
ncbi:unnamed protein product [Mycena citricolor]|uniref:Ras GEF n=2 Tax=Mycena citricolor TaxID=2018698 RepID=A0AAD2HAU1_9AGAR|nr:unnamed protein product [Mycena citricolor]